MRGDADTPAVTPSGEPTSDAPTTATGAPERPAGSSAATSPPAPAARSSASSAAAPGPAGAPGRRAPGSSTGPGAPADPFAGRPGWAEARTRAHDAVRRRPAPRAVPLAQARDHTLAAPLTALTDLPAFDTAAMDGWAVAGPGPWQLTPWAVPEGVLAGDTRRPVPLAAGQAVPIATGARLPPGATAVLRLEHGEVTGPQAPPGGPSVAPRAAPPSQPQAAHPKTLRATQRAALAAGTDVRPRGQECRVGEVLLPAGTAVTPAVLGLAAAAGYDALPVVPRPRVEVLVLGAELLAAGVPRDGCVRDALGPMLGPWLTALGAATAPPRRLGDDAEELYRALRRVVSEGTVDLVVTTGGTAVGPADHVHPVVRRLGGRLLIDGVAVRPGHPMLLAELPDGILLAGLPGNPLAAVSGLFTLVEPVLAGLRAPTDGSGGPVARAAAAAATRGWPPALRRARLRTEVAGHPRDTRLVPVALTASPAVPPSAAGPLATPPGDVPGPPPETAPDGRPDGPAVAAGARPLRFAGPAMLRGVAVADALAVVPPGGVRMGDEVELLTPPWT